MKLATFLMFEGRAEEAMTFYTSLFLGSEVLAVSRDGDKIQHARFSLAGRELQCIDSPIHHGFTFTPAMSLAVSCETEAEIDRLFAALSNGGSVLMPLGEYPFAKKYAWLNDRFGVSWQLTLPA
jgi:predicted 3-demethylubiquinone-9 3-methyltransferase (glyoxalase superfamily)